MKECIGIIPYEILRKDKSLVTGDQINWYGAQVNFLARWKLFYNLTVVVTWVYRFVKTHQNVHFKLVHFIACEGASRINWMEKSPARGVPPADV